MLILYSSIRWIIFWLVWESLISLLIRNPAHISARDLELSYLYLGLILNQKILYGEMVLKYFYFLRSHANPAPALMYACEGFSSKASRALRLLKLIASILLSTLLSYLLILTIRFKKKTTNTQGNEDWKFHFIKSYSYLKLFVISLNYIILYFREIAKNVWWSSTMMLKT